MADISNDDTEVFALPRLNGPSSTSSHVHVDIAARTHTGNHRPINEDHYIVAGYEIPEST